MREDITKERKMSTVPEIKRAILDLPKAEYAEIIEWLYELEEEDWDRQIEEDATTGRLDFLKAQAEEAMRNGTLEDL